MTRYKCTICAEKLGVHGATETKKQESSGIIATVTKYTFSSSLQQERQRIHCHYFNAPIHATREVFMCLSKEAVESAGSSALNTATEKNVMSAILSLILRYGLQLLDDCKDDRAVMS